MQAEDGSLNEAALNEEISLKLAEEIVKDPARITKAVEQDRGLIGKLLDFVRGLKNQTMIRFGKSESAMLDEAERTLVNLLRGRAVRIEGERYSIRQDADGKPFVEIDEDILAGVPNKDKIKTVAAELRRRYPDGFNWRGWKIDLNGQGIREFTRSLDTQRLSKKNQTFYNDKLRTVANLDEIIEVADNIRNESPAHPRRDNLSSFNRADVRIRVGQNDYTAEVVTAIKPSTKEIFYDIVNLRPMQIKTYPPASTEHSMNVVQSDTDMSLPKSITNEEQFVNPEKSTTNSLFAAEKIREQQRVLREERKAWEQSAEIQQLIAERNAVRKENGMFNGVLKKWQEDHPEWQAYLDQRRAYNDRARRLVELEEQLTDQARNREAGRLEMQRMENEQARRAYEESVEQSGLTPAAYRQQEAERVFGTTESYEKAGFILPDGRMLDFSGGETTRSMDHREIDAVFPPTETAETAARGQILQQFLDEGNVRVMAERPGIEISAVSNLSASQIEQIRRMADTLGAARQEFAVDFSDQNGNIVGTKHYSGTIRGSKVVNDIRRFYETGVMPENTVTDEFHSLAVTPNTESNLPWREYARQRYSQLQGRMAGSQGKVNAADTAGVQNTAAVGTATATQDGPVQNATPFPIHDSTQEMATENTVPLPIAGDSDPRVESQVFFPRRKNTKVSASECCGAKR